MEYSYDPCGRLVKTLESGLNEEGNRTTLVWEKTYNGLGQVTSETDPLGNVTTYTYNSRNQNETVQRTLKTEGAADQTLTTYMTYDLGGRMSAQVSPKHYTGGSDVSQMVRTEYTYDGCDRAVLVREHYKVDGTLVSAVVKGSVYDKEGHEIKTVTGEAFKEAQGNSDLEKLQNAVGATTTYTPDGLVARAFDARGYGPSYTYDGMGRKVKEALGDGSETLYTLDDAGKALRVTRKGSPSDPEKLVEKNTYDLAGNLILKEDGLGNKTAYAYNGLRQPRSIKYPQDGSIGAYTETLKYDKNGRLVLLTGTNGKTVEKTYDPQGRLITETAKDGKTVSTKAQHYDVAGQLRYTVDPNGGKITTVYDSLGRKLSETTTVKNTDGTSTENQKRYTYDLNGNVVKETTKKTRDGQTYTSEVERTYDDLNRVIELKDGTGALVEKLAYNLDHRQITSTTYKGDPAVTDNAVVKQFEYDRSGNLIKTINGEGHITSQMFDGLGRVISIVDGNGNGRAIDYDKVTGKVKGTINALGEKTQNTYDINGNLLTQTDGNGNTTSYEYNCRNLPVKRIDAGGRILDGETVKLDPAKTETYTYHPDGQLKTKHDRNGVDTHYAWSLFGSEASKEAAGVKIESTYDAAGNKLTMADPTGRTTRSYDELNRCLVKSTPGVGTSLFDYDKIEGAGDTAALVETFTDPFGKATKTYYDKAGRVSKVVDPDGNETTIEYNPNGSKKKVTYPGGVTEEYTYNKADKLVQLKNTHGSTDTYTYEYDKAGNLLKKTEPGNKVTTYTYDRLNRLETVTEPGGRTTQYAYDKAGNRLRQIVNDGTKVVATLYVYNAQNRLVGTTEETIGNDTGSNVQTDSVEYIYDNNGNLLYHKKSRLTKLADPLNPPQAHFSAFILGQTTVEQNEMVAWIGSNKYDPFNQLIESKSAGGTVVNKYNGEGLRTAKTSGGETINTLYLYDQPTLETDGRTLKARTVYAGSMALSRTMDSETYFYLYNGHADVVALVSESGSTAAEYTYDAFGVPLTTTGNLKNPLRYGGYEYDPETGYYYLKARMYDPKLARFLQEDSYRGDLKDPLSLNLYTYCHNDPMNYSDPTGHFILPPGVSTLLKPIIKPIADKVIDVIVNPDSHRHRKNRTSSTDTKKEDPFVRAFRAFKNIFGGYSNRNTTTSKNTDILETAGYPMGGGGYGDELNVQYICATGSLVTNIKELEKLADEYYSSSFSLSRQGARPCSSNPMQLVLGFIRRDEYGNQSVLGGDGDTVGDRAKDFLSDLSNGLQWSTTAGSVDLGFVEYVRRMNPDLINYFSADGPADQIIDPITKSKIDFDHLIAGANTVYFQSNNDSSYVHLSGWAGDLQQSIMDLRKDEVNGRINNQNRLNSLFKGYIGNRIKGGFTESDMISDIDGYNIGVLLDRDYKLSDAIKNYYSEDVESRFTLFQESMGGRKALQEKVNRFTTNISTPVDGFILNKYYNRNAVSRNKLTAMNLAFMQYIDTQVEIERTRNQ